MRNICGTNPTPGSSPAKAQILPHWSKWLGLVLALLCLSTGASAHSSHAGDIAIGHAWAKPDVAEDGSLTARFPLLNNGKAADSLTGVEAEGATTVRMEAGGAEAHEVALPPQKPVPVTLILFGLKGVKAGDHIPLTMHFANAPDGKIEAHVESKPGD